MQRKVGTRRVDELGRVVLPLEARIALGIRNRQSLGFFVEDDSIIIKLNNEEPCCGLCGASETQLTEVSDNFICEDCIYQVKSL